MPYKVMLSLFVLFSLAATDLFAQAYPGRKLVSCQRENIRFADFFTIVYHQTKMQAFYNDEQLSSDERISVNFQNEPLDNVLALLLGKRGMKWCYREEVFVVMYRKPGEVALAGLFEEESRTVTGLVVNEKKEPLAHVLVMPADGLTGTTTDKQGRFVLSDLEEDTKLLVRRTGYKSMYLSSYADSVYVQLVPLIAPLEAVNVNGIQQNLLTGSASSVGEEAMTEQPVSNVLSVLQGRVPGLYISQTTGLPGGGYRIRLRGKNSIESVSDPLILVDGIPFPAVSFNEYFANPGANIAASPLNLLTINDIASIDILKDADATAIYGSKGANGVILINSKTPRPGNKGLTANFYSGWGKAVNLIRYLDTRQYVEMRLEAIRNDGREPDERDYDLTLWDTTRYTDWQKEMIGGTAHISDGSLELKGGNRHIFYRVSGNYRQESTIYPGDFRYRKGGVRAQANYHSKDQRLKVALSGNYTGDNNRLPARDLTGFSNQPPNTPFPYTIDGKLNFEDSTFQNPYGALLRISKARSNYTNIYANGAFEPVKNLLFTANLGMGLVKANEVQVNPAKSFGPFISEGYSYFSDSRFRNDVFEFQGSWKKNVGRESFKIVLGTRLRKEDQFQEDLEVHGYTDDALLEDREAGTKVLKPAKVDSTYFYHSLYGRLEYKHANKYILTLTGNQESSTRLTPGYRDATFWTTGAAWVFSRENWIKAGGPLSYGKLRASWGFTGNDQYMRHTKGGTGTYIPWSVLLSNVDYNNAFSWEKIRKAEVALDLGLLEDRLLLTLAYYNNQSTNQLLTGRDSVPHSYIYVPVNFPATVENKGLELDLRVTLVSTNQLIWTSTFNFSLPRNRLVKFPALDKTKYRDYYTIGMPLDILKGPNLLDVDPQTGLYRFEISGANPSLEDYYRSSKEFGPTFYGGLQHYINYKGFELSCLLRFARQNNYNYKYNVYMPGSIGNQVIEVMDRWQQPGDHATVQRFSTSLTSKAGDAYGMATFSDQRLTDASYIRLQSLMLGYHFPKKLLQRIKAKSCKLYIQGLNLFTLTKYGGRDPEVGGAETYPSLRVITAGMQLSF